MKRTSKIEMISKKEKKQLSIGLLIVVCLILAGLFAFLKFYDAYIDRTLYAERLSQMKEVTSQLFSGLEDVVKNEWKEAEHQALRVMDDKPVTLKAMIQLMKKERELNKLAEENINLVAVDSNGNYYTQSGRKGLLAEKDYLLSEPNQVSFVTNFVFTDDTKMVYLQKLSEPLTLQDGDDTIVINYYGISQSMSELNPYFACSAYHDSNSVYVVDADGLKLFNSGNKELVKGYNVYAVMEKMKYLHGSSFDRAKRELEEKGVSYSNAVLNGEEVYYAMYHMENTQWTLIFMVPSSYVAMNTVALVNMTIRLVLIFAVGMIAFSGILIFLMLKRQQKTAIEAERKNSEVLEKLNGELEIAVKEADAANKAKSDFLANMSHDIRTPMNAIVGITSLMEHEEVSDKLHGYIEKVQLSSRHLLGLINDILDMSRIESNEVELNRENVSLAEQVGQIDSIIRAQTNEHNQTFRIHVNKVVHEYLICDGVRLRQIFLNLLSNAVKYTPDGGNIVFDIAEVPCPMPEYAKFIYTVTDDGYGMTPEFVKHIFEPFTRAEDSVTNKVQGTGLGMAITKNIVDLMGGEIHVESEVGKGSRFEVVVTFPIDFDADYRIGADKILLISDEEHLICNMKASLRESATQLYVVPDEKEAIAYLEKESPDIILLTGYLKKKELRETTDIFRNKGKKEVLIFCVDYIQEDTAWDIQKESGIDGIISRPFFLSNLVHAITRTDAALEMENNTILSGKRFLCAEDNELNAEILKEILEMYGASCTIYSNGKEIVQAFKSVKPGDYDAILMDVQMPVMNGLEATRAIRNSDNPLGKEMLIIAMTANAFSEDVQHCISAGMDAHIAKPIDIAILEKTLCRFSSGGGR